VIRGRAAPEPLLQVRSPDPLALLQAAYHLGQRHVAHGAARRASCDCFRTSWLEELLQTSGAWSSRGSPHRFSPNPAAYAQAQPAIPIPIPFPTEPGARAPAAAAAVSPALPVGAFSLFRGPEVLVQAQRITSAGDLRSWLGGRARPGCDRVIEGPAALGPLQVGLASMARGEA